MASNHHIRISEDSQFKELDNFYDIIYIEGNVTSIKDLPGCVFLFINDCPMKSIELGSHGICPTWITIRNKNLIDLRYLTKCTNRLAGITASIQQFYSKCNLETFQTLVDNKLQVSFIENDDQNSKDFSELPEINESQLILNDI